MTLKEIPLRLVDVFRGTDALTVYREYLKTQWDSPGEIQARQNALLRLLVGHAYENVPYYREALDRLAVRPQDIQSADDLYKLPLIEKEMIRSRQQEFTARDTAPYSPRRKSTGGSTGRPVTYLLDRPARSAHWAAMYRQWHTGGWRPGDRIVYMGGASIFPSANDILKFVYIRLNNWMLFSSFEMTEENMREWLRRIRESGVAYMHAYVSSANLLASFAEAEGFSDIRFKSVYTSAESLPPQFRENIGRVFGCEVFDLYGANDGGGFAFECEKHNGLHCGSERAIMEILDESGRPVPPGESGELVVTDLLNYSVPFIRYRVGDLATRGRALCSCGRGLPVIESIQGRTYDFVWTKNGKKVHGAFFGYIMRTLPWVDQFTVVQEENGDLVLLIRTSRPESSPEVTELRDKLVEKLEGSTLSIRTTQELPVTAGGKHRFILNKMKRGKDEPGASNPQASPPSGITL